MKIVEESIKGVFRIQLKPHFDHRGFFMRTYEQKLLDSFDLNHKWVQENHSRSLMKGTIRGLHFQFPPYADAKIVRCSRGCIFDVIVDLRINSPTFGKWIAVELSDSNFTSIYIPRGCAHGFCTLQDNCDVLYKHDNIYKPDYESGILWNDPILNIPWPVEEPILSERDQTFMNFNEFVYKHQGLKTNEEIETHGASEVKK